MVIHIKSVLQCIFHFGVSRERDSWKPSANVAQWQALLSPYNIRTHYIFWNGPSLSLAHWMKHYNCVGMSFIHSMVCSAAPTIQLDKSVNDTQTSSCLPYRINRANAKCRGSETKTTAKYIKWVSEPNVVSLNSLSFSVWSKMTVPWVRIHFHCIYILWCIYLCGDSFQSVNQMQLYQKYTSKSKWKCNNTLHAMMYTVKTANGFNQQRIYVCIVSEYKVAGCQTRLIRAKR